MDIRPAWWSNRVVVREGGTLLIFAFALAAAALVRFDADAFTYGGGLLQILAMGLVVVYARFVAKFSWPLEEHPGGLRSKSTTQRFYRGSDVDPIATSRAGSAFERSIGLRRVVFRGGRSLTLVKWFYRRSGWARMMERLGLPQ
tara:strand:+ start:917 stop:1348 length:432 start_codon:yes stop_codon:yes gene_type:complete